MTYTEMPGCCGIIVFHELGIPNDAEGRCDCEECCANRGDGLDDDLKDALANVIQPHEKRGAALATTNQDQLHAEVELTAKGFELLRVFVSPKTHSTIKLWFKDLTKG